MNKTDDFYCLHSDMCKTLASEKRQRILDALRAGERSVAELQECTGASQSNISQHLSVMRMKGIVNARREGSHVFYSISNPKILQAFDLISEVLTDKLENTTAMAGTMREGESTDV
jgi:ArsR family transcriptional regulator